VILFRTAAEAEAPLRQVAAWVSDNSLTLRPDKIHVGDSVQPGQGFEFLGYRFEAGRRLVRKKSLTAFKAKVRAGTARAVPAPYPGRNKCFRAPPQLNGK
jgi:RNA-directed DNA polymerase